MAQQYQILLIEDDLPLAELVVDFLQDYEFAVTHAVNGEDALTQSIETFDLIICDVMLPDCEGFELIPRLNVPEQTPVLFLTAVIDDHSQIKGLEIGAADYILKPVSPEVLLARVRANIRLHERRNYSNVIALGELKLDKTLEEIHYLGQTLELTRQEYEILSFFIDQGNTTISRDELFEKVIGRPYDGQDRAADLRISRLRKKLSALDFDELSIDSIRNKGYRFKYWAHISHG
ncbi:response regulator transcription factor [Thalassotalea agarivorans]|uniref:Two component transcriptional regulator, winged helix family n=1 Tax=Thalassotalea agarivorans TaxID=349064 RepID=A0A1I0CX89_THASX|nr:response regulator transcription factor [Thalassotalea agarivorans]SET24472.1 two component transcriptional regulator, winged helix family [Thalassotalea agarivorans]